MCQTKQLIKSKSRVEIRVNTKPKAFDTADQVEFKIARLKLILCEYSVKGTRTIPASGASARAMQAEEINNKKYLKTVRYLKNALVKRITPK